MQPLLSIKNLSIDFHTESSITNALKNITIEINSGEVVALVGESGSGASNPRSRKRCSITIEKPKSIRTCRVSPSITLSKNAL